MRNFVIVLAALSLAACGASSEDQATEEASEGSVSTTQGTITPEPFVPPSIPGFSFPVNEATIAGWTSDLNGEGGNHIALHAWGIWTGLTKITTQSWNGQDLRTYETWDTPATVNCDTAPEDCPTTPRPLTSPGQLPDSPGFAVTVSYDPTVATYIVENNLIDTDTLNGLQGQGTAIGRVVLPNTSIALKPTYYVLAQTDQYSLLKTWPGPPDPAKAWGSNAWPTCVWVDLQNTTVSYGPFTPATENCNDNQSPPSENIVPLGALIHFTLDAEEAALANTAGASASEGDIAVLVAMHVTTRESTEQLTRWTWQSFWWSTDADQPHAPSTQTMVSQRPDLLKQQNLQAVNYAGCSAYQMLDPVQPKTGGESAGVPVLCYNPYLEAGFNNLPALPFTNGTSGWDYEGVHYAPEFGVQTTCMSCHLHAAWKDGQAFAQSDPIRTAPTCDGKGCYDATVYIDMDATYFEGAVTTDALWSIPDSVP